MKTIKLILLWGLTLLITRESGFCESSGIDFSYWARESAILIAPGRIEKGIFQPFCYGINSQIELSTQLLANVVLPNLTVKWAQRDLGRFKTATQFTIQYPTPLLRLLARKGIGGLISPEFEIPQLVNLSGGLLFSRGFTNQMITLKAGVNLGLKGGKLDRRTTIDLPLVYPRLLPLYEGYGLRLGGDYRRQLGTKLDLLTDTDFFLFPGAKDGFAWEHKTLLQWHRSARHQLSLGYKLVYGTYPFGHAWQLFAPLFDYQFAWERK